MSDAGYIKLSLPKLEVSNRSNPSDLQTYLAFSLKLQAYAQKYRIWGVISGTEKEPRKPQTAKPTRREFSQLRGRISELPDDTDAVERLDALKRLGEEWVRYESLLKEFERKKLDAQATLTQAFSNELVMQFQFNDEKLNEDPAALWVAVKDWFMFNTPTILSHLLHEFSNIAITEKECVDFGVRLKTCLSYLKMLGHSESPSSQKEKFMTAIRNHPKGKYETLALITQSSNDYEQLDLDQLIKKLSSSDV
jgi:hypothetical protein